ncbi:hypothetical protein GJ744_011411 [Endocarpon pusillum]|uniref:Uncharacterized protein n=1 Tax=Endocarpon pusillum TaxID=364733 RepID=A0A8H7E177_9EURO|nr:hypothetical protein GJ744_011411 [Endocarpon pusillum]
MPDHLDGHALGWKRHKWWVGAGSGALFYSVSKRADDRVHNAINMAMMISGRVLQGLGGLGIRVLIETVECSGDKARESRLARQCCLRRVLKLLLITLSWAGSEYPWSSYQVLVPLFVGRVGLAGFVALEGTPFVPNPMMLVHLFSNQISASVFASLFSTA